MPVEQFPIHSGIHTQVDDLSARLNMEYADPVRNHLTDGHLNEAVSELSQHPVMEGESELQIIPASELERDQSIDAILEKAKGYATEKALEAIERTEFKGKEVEDAIKGYYQDHTVALALLGRVVKGSEEESRDIYRLDQDKLGVQSPVLSEAIKTLAALRSSNMTNERFSDLMYSTTRVLFSEPSVGQLTLDEETVDQIATEIADINEAAAGHGVRRPSRKEDIILGISNTIEKTRKEVRPAGQLLFHNTSFGADVIEGDDKNLRSQAQQHRLVRSGKQSNVRVTTGSYAETRGEHGGNIHWSESYDPTNYKRLTGTAGAQNPDAKAGMMTFAVPLGEVIAKAPFGRGLKYAVAEAPADTIAVRPNVNPVAQIGPGGAEYIGSGFGVIDRVFWSSDKSYDDATTYEIPVGGPDIVKVNPATQQAESTVYVIQSYSDQLENYRHWRKTVEPDTAVYDELQQDARTMTEKELVAKYGGATAGAPDHATVVTIADLEFDESRSALDAKNAGTSISGKQEFGTWNREAGYAGPVITKLENESIARFEGQFVVPLRASRPDFMNRGDNMVNNPYGENVLADVRRAFL